MFLGVLVAELERVDVGQNELVLALELVFHQAREHGEIDIQQRCQRPHVDHVAKQLALSRILVFLVAHTREWDADDVDIIAHQAQVEGLGVVVDEVAARLHFLDVLRHALWIHRQHDIHAAAAAEVAALTDAHFVPGRQALDVGGENVLGAHRQPHAENSLGKQVVGAGATGAVYVGELDDELID